MAPFPPLREFMRVATPQQMDTLARNAGTSKAYIRHLAWGRRKASPSVAAKIEAASELLVAEGLPRVFREDLNADCASCPFAAAYRAQHPTRRHEKLPCSADHAAESLI